MRFILITSALLLAAGCSQPVAQSASAPVISDAGTSTVAAAQPLTLRRVDPGPRPVQEIERVLIISIDGLRPDLALRAYMPRLRALCSQGSYTYWAETTPEAYTLPCHVTMLTGAPSQSHGVTWNRYIEESYPNVPTLFEVAKLAGYSTAMATGKMKFIVFTKPGTIDHYYLPPDEPVSDLEVATRAAAMLREHQPHVLFVHFPDVDSAGHKSGWGSPEQIEVIQRADESLGMLLDVLAALQLTDSTLVIVTSDHGGANKGHDENDPRSHFIPWVAAGPGIRKDFDLTLQSQRRIGIEDTYATACAVLGIDSGHACTGRPVWDVLESHESAASAAATTQR